MDLISSTTVAGLPAALGAATSANVDSLFPVVVIAVGITLAFYVLGRVIGLFPGTHRRGR